ncbi:MAG: ATP-binding cassette domain-containing protein [Lachnospiraceae bacterium]|nr:ATP-binding cassette domain-containing protein [Lachnospiraceae bacterium]
MGIYVDIKKRLGKFNLDVCFESKDGVLGLLGASGCGKSMILKCIAGIEKPDAGKIILDDKILFDSAKKINLPPQKRKLGYLFQSYALFPNMDVRQNILCGFSGAQNQQEKEKALDEVLELMQLQGKDKHRPHALSGGQQQRVALARILVGNPNLIMLDEPFSALDSHLRERLQIQMQALLKQFGKTVLLVTHNMDEAYRLCKQIVLIEDGTVGVFKNTKDLFFNPESRQAAILTGCKNIVAARKISAHELEIPSWGIRFQVDKPLKDGLCAVAIRAHYFNTEANWNRFPIVFTGELEEPYGYIYTFRYENQQAESEDIWWKFPKSRRAMEKPKELGISNRNIFPLYE